jgi:transposase
VNDVDRPIVVTDIQPPPGNITINELETINFFIDAYDPDGNPLEYSWKLDGTEVSTTDSYDFTTDYNSAGTYMVTLDVTDNFGTDNTLAYLWNVTVNDVDRPIVVNSILPAPGNYTINETETINFSIDAYDPDGNPLEYSWKLDGTEVSIISTYDYITDYNSAGEHIITLDVTDNFVSDNSLNFIWNVTVIDIDQNIIVNDIQPAPGDVTINEAEMINFFIDAYDPDGNPLEYSWKLDGTWM